MYVETNEKSITRNICDFCIQVLYYFGFWFVFLFTFAF